MGAIHPNTKMYWMQSWKKDLLEIFDDMETLLREASEVSGAPIKNSRSNKPWHSEELKSLLVRRRVSESQDERKEISKLIQKMSRRLIREYQNKITRKFWEIFKI